MTRQARGILGRSSRGFAVALVLLAFSVSCAGTSRQYSRTGTAGAVTFLAGGATILVGREIVSVRHPTSGRVAMGTGAAAQAVGLLMIVYALDGLMRASHPHANERPAFRDDVSAGPVVEGGQPMIPPGW